MQHEHVRGARYFHRSGTLQRGVKHRIDAVLGIAHRFLGVASQAVEHTAAVGWRGASSLHHGFSAVTKIQHAGFKFFLAHPLGGVCRHHDSFNAELTKTLSQQGTGGIFQVYEGSSRGRLPGWRGRGQKRSEGFFHGQNRSYRETLFWLGRRRFERHKGLRDEVPKCHYCSCTGEGSPENFVTYFSLAGPSGITKSTANGEIIPASAETVGRRWYRRSRRNSTWR